MLGVVSSSQLVLVDDADETMEDERSSLVFCSSWDAIEVIGFDMRFVRRAGGLMLMMASWLFVE